MGTNFYWRQGYRIAPDANPPRLTAEEEDILLRHPALRQDWQDLDRDDPKVHVGKRSAAGRYCWDCDRTLVQGGPDYVHGLGCIGCPRVTFMIEHKPSCPCLVLDACPNCGKVFDKEGASLSTGSAAVELGFARPETLRPSGVGSASSFSFAQDPAGVYDQCRLHSTLHIIDDEYGRPLTGGEFLTMLDANVPLPLRFTRSIGRQFS